MMRNNTSPMMHMRIYDEDVQKGRAPGAGGIWPCQGFEKTLVSLGAASFFSPPAGINLCSNNNGDCSQLCLPTSPTSRSCMCTAGYSLKSGQQSCVGKTFTATVTHTYSQVSRKPPSGKV